MIEPAHHFANAARDRPFRQARATNHDDGQMQQARGVQFGAGADAAGVLGDDMRDAMGLEQHDIARDFERAAAEHDFAAREWQRRLWCINKAQQIEMLRFGSESREVLPANAEKDVGGRLRQNSDGGVDIGHGQPIVALAGCPGRALEGDEWRLRLRTSRNRVAAHPCRKRVRCVDDVCDALCRDELCEPGYTAEAADANHQGLRNRIGRPSGIRVDRIDAGRRQGMRQLARLRRAAEQKDARRA